MTSTLIAKREIHDVDMMYALSRHEGVSKQIKTTLRAYRKRCANGNQITITYDFSKEFRTFKKGRVYPDPFVGLAVFPREIRAALAQKFYWDLDIINAQPVILSQLAKKYNLPTPALDEYCANRPAILKDMMTEHNLTRDEAKELCISTLFGGFRATHPLLPKMFDELSTLSSKVRDDNEDIYNSFVKKKKNNPRASLLSFIAQEEERKILFAIDDFLTSQGRPMDVLIFDGGLIRKLEGESEFPPDLLETTEKAIQEKTGYSISLLIKPLSHSYEMKENNILPENVLVNDAYAAKVLVDLAGDSILKHNDEVYCMLDGVWSKGEKAMRTLIWTFRNQLVFKQESSTGLKIRDYGGTEKNITPLLKQIPLFCKEDKLPIQFSYSLVDEEVPTSQAAVDRFLDLVGLWAQHNDYYVNLILNYFAHCIQQPTVLPGVMLIVLGGKGCGKDTLANFMIEWVIGKMYGNSYNRTEQFFNLYDTGRRNKVLVRLEEANRKICVENADILKSWVTSSKIDVNEKHKDTTCAENFCRFIFTSNDGNPVSLDQKERRFLLLNCSEEKIGNRAFWDETYNLLFCESGAKSVGEFLAKRDISTYNCRDFKPTEYQEVVQDTERSAEERFIEQWNGVEMNCSDLFELYRDFCIEKGFLHCNNVISFSRRILPYTRNGAVKVRRVHGVSFYSK